MWCRKNIGRKKCSKEKVVHSVLMLQRCQGTERPHVEVVADVSKNYFRGVTRVGTGMKSKRVEK